MLLQMLRSRVCSLLIQQATLSRHKATAAAVKPFHYQEIFEADKPADIPWKKLSSVYTTFSSQISVQYQFFDDICRFTF